MVVALIRATASSASVLASSASSHAFRKASLCSRYLYTVPRSTSAASQAALTTPVSAKASRNLGAQEPYFGLALFLAAVAASSGSTTFGPGRARFISSVIDSIPLTAYHVVAVCGEGHLGCSLDLIP